MTKKIGNPIVSLISRPQTAQTLNVRIATKEGWLPRNSLVDPATILTFCHRKAEEIHPHGHFYCKIT